MAGGPFDPPPLLGKTIPSYVYWEYADDDDIQAWVEAYNTNTQQYVDWFNSINLPIYTGPQISGALLDWVAHGLYGLVRPVLGTGHDSTKGPYNTFGFNDIPFNALVKVSGVTYQSVSDDIFKRIITWHFFKGDGKVFSIKWLKRRVMRFLVGDNGTAPIIDQTYRISVTFGADSEVSIRIIDRLTRITDGAIFNTFGFNGNPRRTKITGGAIYDAFAYNTESLDAMRTGPEILPQAQRDEPFNALNLLSEPVGPPFAHEAELKEAIDQGVLELPFQFTYDVEIDGSLTPPPFNI